MGQTDRRTSRLTDQRTDIRTGEDRRTSTKPIGLVDKHNHMGIQVDGRTEGRRSGRTR